MSRESMVILWFIICLVIGVVLIIIDDLYNKVEKISENVKYLKKLNNDFSFKYFNQKQRRINHQCHSYRQYDRTSSSDVIGYHIENNIDYLRDDIEIAIHNKKIYDNYLKVYELIDYNTNSEIIKKEVKSEKIFKKIESKLLKKYKIKNVYNITINLYVGYTSPRGKNSYKKSALIKFEHLYNFYIDWLNGKKYEISARYERSIMTDSMRYDVLKRDNFRCRICGISANEGAKLHVDHIIPVSKGGKTRMDNLQTLCDRCNMGKSNKY